MPMKQKKVNFFRRDTKSQGGFTLLEVVASLLILSVVFMGILAAFQRSCEKAQLQFLRERAFSVAQRHMEMLIASHQEPNSVGFSNVDELDPLFNWQLELTRISGDSSPPKPDLTNTVIKATIKVTLADADMLQMPPLEVARYFAWLKPMSGAIVAVPLTTEEEPLWYTELRAKLGREPTMEEIMNEMLKSGELPQDLFEEMEEQEANENQYNDLLQQEVSR